MKIALEDWITSTLGGNQVGASDEIAADCFSCGKEKHLYVNAKTGLAVCFRCGYTANLEKIIRDVQGVSKERAWFMARLFLRDDIEVIRTRAVTDDVKQLLEEFFVKMNSGNKLSTEAIMGIDVPPNQVELNSKEAIPAIRYLLNRGFNKHHWSNYCVRYVPCESSFDKEWQRFNGHLIFTENDRLDVPRYYTSRRVDLVFSDEELEDPYCRKSYHAKHASHKNLLFGRNGLIRSDVFPIFLVEGPLDMLALSGYSICLLGKLIHQTTAWNLKKLNRPVVIALDDDAENKGIKQSQVLTDVGIEKVFVSVGMKGDPGDHAKYGRKHAAAMYLKSAKPITDGLRIGAVFRDKFQGKG